jgi:hypothetical protein
MIEFSLKLLIIDEEIILKPHSKSEFTLNLENRKISRLIPVFRLIFLKLNSVAFEISKEKILIINLFNKCEYFENMYYCYCN